MTRPNLATALLFAAIVGESAPARSADGAEEGSLRGRSVLVAPHTAGVQDRSGNAAGPRSEPHAAAAETPSVFVGQDFNSCRKVPTRKRTVKVGLKPNTNVDDLIAWISSITCRKFVWSETIAAHDKTVTIVAPLLMTPRQAFGLFLDALDSIGLTAEPSGTFWRIIETGKVKSTPIPLYGWDGRRLTR